MSSYETFMNLDKKGCLMASKGLMDNAKAKFKDAETLAEVKSYSTSSSLMITSMEESIKSMILAMDSIGFKFRTNVKGIKGLFKQHGLRYQFAFILSVVNILTKDLKAIHNQIKDRKNLVFGPFDHERVIRRLKIKVHNIKKEIEWFERIGFHRERGLYYDIKSGIIDPANFSKVEYEMIAQRVKGVISIVEYIHLVSEDKESRDYIINFQQKFITEKWYHYINMLAKKVNENKGPIFDETKGFVEGFEETLEDEESIQFMRENIAKLNQKFEKYNIGKNKGLGT